MFFEINFCLYKRVMECGMVKYDIVRLSVAPPSKCNDVMH